MEIMAVSTNPSEEKQVVVPEKQVFIPEVPPEVVPFEHAKSLHQDGTHNSDSTLEATSIEKGAGVRPQTTPPKRRICGLSRRKFWFITIGIMLLIVIGVVVGVVLGTRKTTKSNSSTAPSSTPGASALSIRKNSPLAVTGWREAPNSNFSIRLFYQDTDDWLRVAEFDSPTKQWKVVNETGFVQAKPGTPLAASSFNWTAYDLSNKAVQIELFHLDTNNLLREYNFNILTHLNGNGSLSTLRYPVSPGSRFASYWPTIVYQNSSGLQSIQWEALAQPAQDWNNNSLNYVADPSASVVVLPVGPDYSGTQLFYQSDAGDLTNIVLDSDETTASNLQAQLGTLSQKIPPATSIGAFATPRVPNTGNLSDYYVLWQDTGSGDIQVNWLNDAEGWKGPATFDALGGADNGTEIACLTPSITPGTVMVGAYDMCRCYFQVKGKVREVQMNGSNNWAVVGDLPMG